MQVVKYEINKNILTVGFKEDNFVVYAQVGFDENKTKDELLQLAYIQAKPSIEYEKTLDEHSFVTEEGGEEFVPELPKPTTLNVDFDSLEGKVIDQYGDIFYGEVEFYIESDVARIEDSVVVEDIVEEDTDYTIYAKHNDLEVFETRTIYPSIPSDTHILREEISPILYDEFPKTKKELEDVSNALNTLLGDDIIE